MTISRGGPAAGRETIAASATPAVRAGVLALSSISPRAFATGDEIIRVGLVGCGGRGTGAVKNALSTKGDVRLVAMADLFEDQLENSLRQIRASFAWNPSRVAVDPDRCFVGFDAYRRLLATDVDVVILATPPGFRPIHFRGAVSAGKHVFMEKPIAVDAPGVRKIMRAISSAERQNLKVGVGLQRRHHVPYQETIARLHDGAIGDILFLRVNWNSGGITEISKTRRQSRSEMEYQLRNWYFFNWLCGDHIVEQHIHNLDVGNWVKQATPVLARGMGGREVRTGSQYGEIFDHHAVQFQYADGTWMFSQCRHIPNTWNNVTEHAIGTKGTADITGARYVAGPHRWKFLARRNQPYQAEFDNLFAAIRECRPYNEALNGAHSTMTAIMGRMASYSGQTIDWETALNSDVSLMPKRFGFDAAPPVLPNLNGEYPIAVPGVIRVV